MYNTDHLGVFRPSEMSNLKVCLSRDSTCDALEGKTEVAGESVLSSEVGTIVLDAETNYKQPLGTDVTDHGGPLYNSHMTTSM